MRNNAITVALMFATFTLPSIVHAADPKLEKLSSVQADIILLQAQNDREELIQKLKKMQEKPDAEVKEVTPQLPSGSPTPPPPFSMPAPFADIAKAQALAQAQEQAQAQGNQPWVKEEKPVQKVVEKVVEIPVLRGVVGAGAKLYATIAYNSGQELDATVGDPLPGGFTVVSISVNKVVLKDKAGKKIELLRSMGGERAPANATDGEPQGNVMLSVPQLRGISTFPGVSR